MEEQTLSMLFSALNIIHGELLIRNAYDMGILSKDEYMQYLRRQIAAIPEEDKE